MKTKSLINALKKANLKIESNDNGQSWVKANGRVLSWYDQDGRVICLHCRRENDHTDLMTDYHAGFYVSTIKRALEYVSQGA